MKAGTIKLGWMGWADHRFARNIKYRVTMMESALELCRKGLCVAYLPEFVVKLHNENVLSSKKLIELASPIPSKDRQQSVFIIYRKDSTETHLHRQVAKALRSLNS
jgi:DNA-binding transcriptional LysR family regulator